MVYSPSFSTYGITGPGEVIKFFILTLLALTYLSGDAGITSYLPLFTTMEPPPSGLMRDLGRKVRAATALATVGRLERGDSIEFYSPESIVCTINGGRLTLLFPSLV